MRGLRPGEAGSRTAPTLNRRAWLGLTGGLSLAAAIGALTSCSNDDAPDEADLEPIDAEDEGQRDEDERDEDERDEDERDEDERDET